MTAIAHRRPVPRAGKQPPPWYHLGPVLALAGDTGDGEDDSGGGGANSADVYVYDVIGGWWGMSADDFVRDVAGLDVDQIVLHLNTPGGDAMEGVAIANVLRAHKARIVVRVDGMAASAGSVIAMAGDEVIMGIGSQLMVHDAWGYAVGNAAEMRKAAAMLDSTSNSYAAAYATKAGGSAADWRTVMEAEAWYTGDEAVQAGLADRVAAADETGTAEGEQITPGRSSGGFWDMWDSLADPGRFDLSQFPFTYGGRAQAPKPAMPGREPTPVTPAEAARRMHAAAQKKTPVADPAGGPPTIPEGAAEMQFTDEERTSLRARFSLAADADDDAIKAAMLAAPAVLPANPPAGDPPANTGGDPAPAAAVSADGQMVIDRDAWDQTQKQIRDLQVVENRRRQEERDAVIAQAVKDGKFAPARKEHYERAWDADPDGARALIAGLAKNVVPMGELGYASGEDVDTDGAEFDNLFPPHMRQSAKVGR